MLSMNGIVERSGVKASMEFFDLGFSTIANVVYPICRPVNLSDCSHPFHVVKCVLELILDGNRLVLRRSYGWCDR